MNECDSEAEEAMARPGSDDGYDSGSAGSELSARDMELDYEDMMRHYNFAFSSIRVENGTPIDAQL